MSCPKQINQYLDECLRTFCFSGYSLEVSSPSLAFSSKGGSTSYWPGNKKIEANTLFDIGSMTKVVATVSVLARLFDQKKIDLKETIQGFSLLSLLTHSSGLKAWLPLFESKNFSFNTSWVGTAPSKSVYSDLGFLLLHDFLKSKFGSIAELFQEEVKKPLGLKDTQYNPAFSPQIVATEYCHYRKKMIQGEVFDENTSALGGVSTHAGLFSLSHDLIRWGNEWLNARKGKSSWISKETALLFTTKQKENWALGFDTKSASGSTLGNGFSLETFGHLGYPGTSIWMDPVSDAVVVFLTNRIHPSRLDERIKQVRPKVHEQIFEAMKVGGSIGNSF